MDPPSMKQVVVDYTPYPPTPWWLRVPFSSTKPSSPPLANIDDAPLSPELLSASWYARITFSWVYPILATGYARPLDPPDLYRLDNSRLAEVYGKKFSTAFQEECDATEEYNKRLEVGDIRPSLIRRLWWRCSLRRSISLNEKELNWRTVTARKTPSLVRALNRAVFWWLWIGGFLKLLADVGLILSPLLVKAIINFATESYSAHPRSDAPSIGRGIAMAIGLMLLQLLILLCNAHSFYRSFTTGVILRTGLISAIFGHALLISPRARIRSDVTAGKLVAMISTDVSRIDFSMAYFHMAWTSPVQMIICLIVLCVNLGPSALPGFAFFLFLSPVQSRITKQLFRLRKKSMVWTDKRVKLLQEVLGSMRLVKFFAWEHPFIARIAEYRKRELQFLRSRLLLRSLNNAFAFSLPSLAAVISFVTYSLSGHPLDPAIIFSSLTLFQLLRTPLTFLPVALNAIADASNATSRIRDVLLTEKITNHRPESDPSEPQTQNFIIDPSMDNALSVDKAWFTWDPSAPSYSETASTADTTVGEEEYTERDPEAQEIPALATTVAENPTPDIVPVPVRALVTEDVARPITEEKLSEKAPQPSNKKSAGEDGYFHLDDISLSIPKGQLVAIVGPVGSGKSSLLQGLIGEMHRTHGTVRFGGSVAYCPQTPWIQSASIRDNITFGLPFDEKKYRQVIENACLVRDFEILKPDGDLTEVGEKGISLSGGQKQRISIARALYSDASIILFDDSLSALDAHVGKQVFRNAIQRAPSGTTRILVTHSLTFLPSVDWIIALGEDEGSDGYLKNINKGRAGVSIQESGTFANLKSKGGIFSQLIRNYGSTIDDDEQPEEKEEIQAEDTEPVDKPNTEEAKVSSPEKAVTPAPTAAMMAEERNKGSVSGAAYKEYFLAANVGYLFPLFIFAVVIFQGSSILSPYWLVWWQETRFPLRQGTYMAIYAVLGFTQALGVFFMGSAFALLTFHASLTLHKNAIDRIIHAPILFFDTTPLGRIMNRMSKDVDTIDNVIGDAMRMFMGTFVQIIGAIALISSILPWFLIAVAVLLLVYFWVGLFYRSSARELKRLDAVLRSALYAHFAESLSGLPTIRAFGASGRFKRENEKRIDIENRAYWLTVTNQRWLSVRLDLLGSLLTFVVALLVVGTRFTISPGQTGLMLSYILVVQQAFSWMVRQSAEVENNMNGVERMLHYANHIETEASYEDPKPPSNDALVRRWPATGNVEIRDLSVRYRPHLPPALNEVTLSVTAGEHVAIVGRTGAGKSTITMALYRLIEVSGGSISIDGVDISKIGLRHVRESMAIIPQDPVLFSGTLRSNLDPFGIYDDLTLNDALKRVRLIRGSEPEAEVGTSQEKEPVDQEKEKQSGPRLSLDSVVNEDGVNFSLGQRSLISLARALVKNSRIIVLDEATASVDYETDEHVQSMITSSFAHRTVLCIAHRLKTIIGYDRVIVMDAGKIVEYGSPIDLFAKGKGVGEMGTFRQLCERSGIGMDDIINAGSQRAAIRANSRN